LFVHYTKLALFPYPLVADYLGDVFPISSGLLEPATLFSILVFFLFLVVGIRIFQRNALMSVGMLWFACTLLPVLQVVPFHELAADHFEYVPMVGVVHLGGMALSQLLQSLRRRGLVWGILGLLALGFSIAAVDRNRDWANKQTLWEATYKVAPGSYRANANLGQIYFQQGLASASDRDSIEKGLSLTRRSIELDSTRPVSWGNLGAMAGELGKRERLSGNLNGAKEFQHQAIEALEKAAELEPDNPFTLSNIGNAYKELGLIYDEEARVGAALEARLRAVELYQEALEKPDRRPLVQAIWLGYGGVFIDAGLFDQALLYLGNFLRAFPHDPNGNYWMGFCYFQLRDYESAIRYLEKAAQAQPRREVWELLATSYERRSNFIEAIETYLRGLTQSPNSSELHYKLGLLYKRTGESRKAMDHLRVALGLNPKGTFAREIRRILNEGREAQGRPSPRE
jgi:tetratricopeptide (TPR) repeat protein